MEQNHKGGNSNMRKIVIIAVVVFSVVMLYGSAFAANSLSQGSAGISVGMGDSIWGHGVIVQDAGNATFTQNPIVEIGGRYFVSSGLALNGSVGLQVNSGDAKGTYLSFSAGLRKYLSTSDFAPFVGGQLTYIKTDSENAAGTTVTDLSIFDLAGYFGAEYFFAKNFSVDGAIGIGLGSWDNSVNNTDGTYLGTRTVGVHANFYF